MVMSAPYICSACRQSILVRLQNRHRLQWLAKAAFTTRSSVRAPRDNGRMEILLDIADAKEDMQIKIPGPSARRITSRSKQDAGDILESLFETTLKNDPSSTTPIQHGPSIDAYRDVETIQQMLGNSRVSRAEVWKYFVKHFEPKAGSGEDQQISRPTAFPIMAQNLLDDIRHASQEVWMSAVKLGSLPTMTDVARTYTKLGLMDHKYWNLLIWDLLCELTRRERLEHQGDSWASNEQLWGDLLGVWRLFCFQYKNIRNRAVHATSKDWSCLPDITYTYTDVFNKPMRAPLDVVSRALFPAFPTSLAEQSHQSIACAAILTYGLLSHPSKTESSAIKTGRPFLKAIGAVICRGWTTRAIVRDQISQRLGITDVKGRDALWKLLLGTNHEQYTPQGNTSPDHLTTEAVSSFHTDIQRRLNYAVKIREVKRIEALFAAVTQHDGDNARESRVQSLELHNQFIKAYMSCRDTGRAVGVWNHMIQEGLTPTILTWTAMLEGCRISRDVRSLESVWMKLRASGIEPDVVCWTTVICGFIENMGGQGREDLNVEKGVRLLEEMGRIWLEAEKKASQSKFEVNKAVKPTVYTMNAVMRSLLARRRFETAGRLLQWAKQFQIKHDIVTYNTLLRSYIRSAQTEKAQEILRDMQTSGVDADIITYTTILEETFRYSSSFTEEERTAVVDNVFSEMSKAGVEANHYTYGKIIYVLLQDAAKTGNISTVQSVLNRMARQNLEPNQYIFTNLVNYYFNRTPPDLAAVEAIIERMRLVKPVDEVIFWDRVIEGYSAVGDPLTALKYFGKYNRVGARVGWIALCTLLQALVNGGHVALAEQFIRDVRLDRRPPPAPDARGEQGEHRFWNMVGDFESNS